MLITRAIVLLLLTMVFVSACSKPKNYQYFLLHPKEAIITYRQCAQLLPSQASAKPECIVALQAARSIQETLQLAVQNYGLDFGAKIIATETTLVKTKETLQQAEQTVAHLKKSSLPEDKKQLVVQQQKVLELKQKIAQLEFKVKSMLAIIRFMASQMK